MTDEPLLGKDPAFQLRPGERYRQCWRVWFSDATGKVRQRTFFDEDVAADYARQRTGFITMQKLVVVEVWNRERRDNGSQQPVTSGPEQPARFGITRNMSMKQRCAHCRTEMRNSLGIVYYPPNKTAGSWVHLTPCAAELGYRRGSGRSTR